MGGSPDERCRSEALFFTTKARSSEISTIIPLEREARTGKGWALGRDRNNVNRA
jgi:hypothetical protein